MTPCRGRTATSVIAAGRRRRVVSLGIVTLPVDMSVRAVTSRSDRIISIFAPDLGAAARAVHLVIVRQHGEQVGQLGRRHFREDIAGAFLPQVGDDLALGPRLGLQQGFRRLLRIQQREHGRLLLARQLFQGVGQVFAGQLLICARVIDNDTVSLATASSSESGWT